MIRVEDLFVRRIASFTYAAGVIQAIKMPRDWTEVERQASFPLGTKSSAVYHPPDDEKTVIALSNRGLAISEEASASFRAYLQYANQLIYSDQEKQKSYNYIDSNGRVSLQAAIDLKEVLGSVHANQLFDSNYVAFYVERAEITTVNGQPVLSVKGWHQDPQTGVRGNQAWTVFVDGDPSAKQSTVLQIGLGAQNAEQFNKYVSVFQDTLNTIEWRKA